MSPAHQKLLQEVEQFVKNIFNTRVSPAFVFHDFQHTKDVVRASKEIASTYQLTEEEELCLLVAAWMHDIGYSSGTANQHEEHSQRLATAFLRDKKVDQQLIDDVNGCIMATKMPQSPTNTIEQIICDADLFHLGTDQFDEKNRLLRQEINELQEEKVGKKQWRQINIEFLQRQRYFTDYGRERLEPVKHRNLQNMLSRMGKKEKEEAEEIVGSPAAAMTLNPERVDKQVSGQPEKPEEKDKDRREKEKDKEKDIEKDKEKDRQKQLEKEEKELAKDAKEKQSRTDRTIVAMFRIMSENHVSLSQMADSKANIMISVNTIVISIMVSVLLGKLQFYPEYIIPTILLVVPCLGAVIFAILATRPNVTAGTFTKEDIQHKEVNLLFFGNFFRMELPEYDWAMRELMKDKEYLYGSMIKDIYFLGVVLARKYKLIRISYNIFMFGLVIAILGFCAAFFFAEKQ